LSVLEKLKGLSTGAKAGIAGGALLVAAAGVGLGVTQPWNQTKQIPVDTAPVQQQQTPQTPEEPEEEKLTVRAGNDVVDCTLFQGDGWSIYVPEGWSAETVNDSGGKFVSGDGAQLEVDFLNGEYDGSFVNISKDNKSNVLQFYQDNDSLSPSVTGVAPDSQWDYYGKLFTALARTLSVGQNSPFGDVYIVPQIPDWQAADGLTVLFLDKDGYVVDQKMRDAVENYMTGWNDDLRAAYTGQYRINNIQWVGCYTGVHEDGFVDVFRANVQYRLADGGEEMLNQLDGGYHIVDGWASDLNAVFLAVFHDGGSVDKTQGIAAPDVQDWISFAALLD